MATIYDVDLNSFSQQMLPVDKRNPKIIAFIQALLVPLQWLSNLFFGDYRTGTTAPSYVTGTYQKYQRVVYNNTVYESLIDGNTDLPITTNWFIVQPNFIGVNERLLYTGQCLTLTYALNKWFGTVYRGFSLRSDIYIQALNVSPPAFVIGQTEQYSDDVRQSNSIEFISLTDSNLSSLLPTFKIFMPSALFSSLPVGIDPDKPPLLSLFVDKYLPAGIIYTAGSY